MGARQSAVVITVVLAACASSAEGLACGATSPCPESYVCAAGEQATFRCMLACDLTETVCSNGAICLPIAPGGGGACFLGGLGDHQARCGLDLDCGRGDVCVETPGLGSYCWYGCNRDHPTTCPAAGSECRARDTNIAYCF
jgi:hypothetical protein